MVRAALKKKNAALTRAQKLCIIMGPLDMRGLMGAATVIGCLKYGVGVCGVHDDNPSAEVYLKEKSLDTFHSRHWPAMTGKQPRGRRLPPFVSEFKVVCKLQCNGNIPPPVIKQDFCFDLLPSGSKTVGSQTLRDKGERAEVTIGIPWEPVQRAADLGHPKLFLKWELGRMRTETTCQDHLNFEKKKVRNTMPWRCIARRSF